MAGDKHFFRHIETVKKETNISLNIWSINPLEVTHFKAGFLGIPPYFDETLVYTHGVMKQLRYQSLRFLAMTKSLGYFNSSLWDTLSGEYYRSFKEKTDYYHLFDYWRWDEKEIEDTLVEEYDWELAPDTKTSWRIGDGSAALYNYIYYLVAGFTEHDTFRSNQIREGDITREEALKMAKNYGGKFPWTYLGRPLEEILNEIDISLDEFKKICDLMKRTPNLTELGIFSAMWNEHCSYKSSRKHLKNLHKIGRAHV